MSTSRSKVMIGFITVLHLFAVLLCCGRYHCQCSTIIFVQAFSFRVTGSVNVCYSVKGKITFIQPVPNLVNKPRPVRCVMFNVSSYNILSFYNFCIFNSIRSHM